MKHSEDPCGPCPSSLRTALHGAPPEHEEGVSQHKTKPVGGPLGRMGSFLPHEGKHSFPMSWNEDLYDPHILITSLIAKEQAGRAQPQTYPALEETTSWQIPKFYHT